MADCCIPPHHCGTPKNRRRICANQAPNIGIRLTSVRGLMSLMNRTILALGHGREVTECLLHSPEG